MKLNRLSPAVLALILTTILSQATGLKDNFSDPNFEKRQALRGEWIFEDNVASCVSDPELYKEFANHGPILRWPIEMIGGTVECEFKPQDCQRLVITLNGDGHIFRISLNDEKRTGIFGWIGKSSKENKSQSLAKEDVPMIASIDGKWTKLKLVIEGEKADIQIGDYVASLRHGSLARDKGEFTISFASGECAVRKVSVTSKVNRVDNLLSSKEDY